MQAARWLSCALLLLTASGSAHTANSPDLEGLWVASVRNGPDVRGTLMIFPRATGLVADMAGFSVPVKQQGSKLSFDLPDDKGSFRGERLGDRIEGQWIQAAT